MMSDEICFPDKFKNDISATAGQSTGEGLPSMYDLPRVLKLGIIKLITFLEIKIDGVGFMLSRTRVRKIRYVF